MNDMTDKMTTDPNDPRLNQSSGDSGMDDAYLVLSEAERAKSFVRPIRYKYVHVGFGGHEIDPDDPRRHGRTGTACGVLTIMNTAIAETYARDPGFYGATYCVGCKAHFLVEEFVWDGSPEERVGS